MLVLGFLVSGCATSTNWHKKVGLVGYEEVTKELGAPRHTTNLANGDTRCLWSFRYRYNTTLSNVIPVSNWLEPICEEFYYTAVTETRIFTFDSSKMLKKADQVSMFLAYPRDIEASAFFSVFDCLFDITLDETFKKEDFEKNAVSKVQGMEQLVKREGAFSVTQSANPFDIYLSQSKDAKSHHYSYPLNGRNVLIGFEVYRSGDVYCSMYCPPR
jgi:hypothetical protein